MKARESEIASELAGGQRISPADNCVSSTRYLFLCPSTSPSHLRLPQLTQTSTRTPTLDIQRQMRTRIHTIVSSSFSLFFNYYILYTAQWTHIPPRVVHCPTAQHRSHTTYRGILCPRFPLWGQQRPCTYSMHRR